MIKHSLEAKEDHQKKETPEEESKKHEGMWKEFYSFIEDFNYETDRAAVILGAAKLDTQLNHLLKKVLVPITSKNDELFEGDSPLASLSAKTLLAYRLGLIDSKFTQALNLIRKIRNTFAHEGRDCKLDYGPESDRIRELRLIFSESKAFESIKKRYFPSSYYTPSADFRTALAMVVVRMQAVIEYATPLPSNHAFPLIVAAWKKNRNHPG